jgi:uncharacterized protein HemX
MTAALGWILLVVLVAGLVAAAVIWRPRRNSAWDAEAAALERDTRTATGTQLPSVLTAENEAMAAGRALSAVLTGVPRQEPPAGGEPGRSPTGQW